MNYYDITGGANKGQRIADTAFDNQYSAFTNDEYDKLIRGGISSNAFMQVNGQWWAHNTSAGNLRNLLQTDKNFGGTPIANNWISYSNPTTQPTTNPNQSTTSTNQPTATTSPIQQAYRPKRRRMGQPNYGTPIRNSYGGL